jgi:AraC-like DNA-binding protein
MTKSDITYASYERRAWRHGELLFVHGRYDGLTTGAIAHPHLQILVPLAGRVHVAGHLIGPGEAAVIPPRTPHATSTLGGELRFLAVNLPESGLPPGIIVVRDAGCWHQGQLLARGIDAGAPPRFMLAGLEQLEILVRERQPVPIGDDAVLRVVQRLLAEHGQDLRVSELAREAGLSARQLERRFQAAVGMAPRRFLIEARLAAARELLATTALSQATIAERAGFKSADRLARAFRAAMGRSPGAYRRERRLHNLDQAGEYGGELTRETNPEAK